MIIADNLNEYRLSAVPVAVHKKGEKREIVNALNADQEASPSKSRRQ